MLTSRVPLFMSLIVLGEAGLAQGNAWTSGLSMPTSRVAPAAAMINSTLYVVGGFTDSAGPYSVVEAYNPTLNTWTPRSTMPTGRGRLAVAVLDSILYAVGGFGGQFAVEAYNSSTNTWSVKAPIQKDRLGAAAGVIGGKLYVVGGTSFDSVQTVEEYDPTANTWTFKKRMPTPRFLLAAAVIGSKLYAVGGTNSVTGGSALGILEVYDPATDTWETKASISTPRSDLAAAVIDGKLYAVGGFGSGGTILEVYDPVLDSWSTLAPMPTSRGDLAAAELNGKLFAIGGTSAPGMTPLSVIEIYMPGATTSVDEIVVNSIPTAFQLSQNYPNPFNPTTTIGYDVPSATIVSVKVYDLFGEEVATLVNGAKPVGYHQIDWRADGLPSGVYFYRIKAGDFVQTKKLILMK